MNLCNSKRRPALATLDWTFMWWSSGRDLLIRGANPVAHLWMFLNETLNAQVYQTVKKKL